MKEAREQVYDNVFNLYIGRLNQVESLQTINRILGASAFLLGFMAIDKPAVFLGLSVALIDVGINEVRLGNVKDKVIGQYHKTKDSVYQALVAEKSR